MSRVQNVGAPQIPNSAGSLFDILNWLRNTVQSLQTATIPPKVISNLRATPLNGSIQVDFTRSDGDTYILLWNTTPSTNQAVRIELGTANKYVDSIGDNAIKRYYTIISTKGNLVSQTAPWVSATSLPLGTTATPPAPPPASDTPITDNESDSIAVLIPDSGDYLNL